MTLPDLVLYDEEFRKIKDSLQRLAADANANVVFLVDKNGQQIAAVGDLQTLDTTSLASLTAGNVAATDGLARLIGEREFSILFHEGERDNIHISIVAQRVILVVIFDERTSLGLVRLRVRRAMAELERIFEDIARKAEKDKQVADRRLRLAVCRDHGRRHRPPVLGVALWRRLRTCGGGFPMTFINYAAREINCKIVYYGPGLCGKTTNLQYIYDRTNPSAKGKLISLATETDRTLFFDFLPLDLGTVKGFKTRFHLYTVPGQVFYDASRKLILKGVDGVVFVADSQEARLEANIESIRNLDKNLKEQGYDIATIPYVLQFNKRDLPTAMPADELYRRAEHQARADVRGRRADGRGRLRHAEGRRAPGPDGPAETLEARTWTGRFGGPTDGRGNVPPCSRAPCEASRPCASVPASRSTAASKQIRSSVHSSGQREIAVGSVRAHRAEAPVLSGGRGLASDRPGRRRRGRTRSSCAGAGRGTGPASAGLSPRRFAGESPDRRERDRRSGESQASRRPVAAPARARPAPGGTL